MRIALVWLENQTGEDTDFIFRGIGYDGTEYWAQVRRRAKIRRSNVKRKKDAPDGEAAARISERRGIKREHLSCSDRGGARFWSEI